MGTDDLRIVRNSNKTEGDGANVFAVEDALLDRSEDELDEIVNWFSHLDIDDDVPIYETIWHRLVSPFTGVPSAPTALTHLIVLYWLLERRILEDSPERLICGDIQRDYQAVITDLARVHNIEVDNPVRPSRTRGYFSGLNGVLRRLLDQLFSVVCCHSYDLSRSVETVFVPNINRFGSMKPVIEEASDYVVAIPRPTVSWSLVRADEPELASFNPIPLDCFVTARTFLKELRLVFITLPLELWVKRRIERRLVENLREEFGVDMERTVAYSLSEIYGKNSMALLYHLVAEEVINRTGCQRMAFGSRGLIQSSMIHTAESFGVGTVHVPHTVTIGYETIPREATYIATGDVAIRHFYDSNQIDDVSNIEPLGRPYLRELQENKPSRSRPRDSCKQIVIATQPYNDNVRKTFVTSVLAGTEAADLDADVVIKIHPNEEPDFYERLPETDPDNIVVATGDLQQYVVDSDLVVTINSNVGIEAVVMGTPCVCVNLYSPLIRTRPYARYSPIPTIYTSDGVVDWFGDVTEKKLEAMCDEQSRFIWKKYKLDENTAEAIVNYLKDV